MIGPNALKALFVLFDLPTGHRAVLEFMRDDSAWGIRAGPVLSNEVHLLQLPHGRVFKGIVRTVCPRGVPRDRRIPSPPS
jgi:hypothetical protein